MKTYRYLNGSPLQGELPPAANQTAFFEAVCHVRARVGESRRSGGTLDFDPAALSANPEISAAHRLSGLQGETGHPAGGAV